MNPALSAGGLFLSAAAAVVLFFLPGMALIELSPILRERSFIAKAGLAGGLSLTVYPLLFLAADLAGFKIGRTAILAPALASLAFLGFRSFRSRRRLDLRPSPETMIFLLLAAALFVVRMAAVKDMIAPAWGDSVHHTTIVQLMIRNGGLFDSWAPYAPMSSFTYHFAFHAAAASWAFLLGASAPLSVLVVGQILNVLAVLAVVPLALFLTRSKGAALAAMAAAGFITILPGFFVNWGRYTQLAGQVILPVGILLAAELWEGGKTRLRRLWPLSLIWAGIFLAHYRVMIVLGAGSLVIALIALVRNRFAGWKAWPGRAIQFLLAVGAGGLIVLPWILNFLTGGLPKMIEGLMSRSGSGLGPTPDLEMWTRLDQYYGGVPLWIGLAALACAVVANKWFVLQILAGWYLLSFLIANPSLFGLPGGKIESNAVVVFSLYIPLSILIGWAVSAAAQQAERFLPGKVFLFWALAFVLVLGGGRQIRIVDPWYQMMTSNDADAFGWIRRHVPAGARFLTNGFLAYSGMSVVGSDGGWWLTLWTGRESWLPAFMYRTERLRPGFDRDDPARIAKLIPGAIERPGGLAELCRRERLTYMFLGEKRGSVGFDAVELLPEDAVRRDGGFSLVYARGRAQVWRRMD